MTTRPLVICLHGSGSSAAIFRAQARRICSALQSQINFLFIDAPFEGPAGPGVLPFFEDAGPYFYWFTDDGHDEQLRMAEWNTILSTLEAFLGRHGYRTTDVKGVMGFSQGALVGSILLKQAKAHGDERWAGLSYGLMLCGGGGEQTISKIGLLDVPSVHLHGMQDPYLINSRRLLKCYDPTTATIITHSGSHHIPTSTEDVDRLATAIARVSKEGA
ncbi:uncharacterized protein LTHEOB_10369 [Neofusicoccum parvum]|uniref:Uncharacterized protein LTHEOB_10369 n=1 Tax=Neofusicoccum parvum TaxID=310453 RepID=A0ACB5SCA4_9PEZI|nr:uncharacterized protein LTHEOB_10369 [Neofusicoccum parvum]